MKSAAPRKQKQRVASKHRQKKRRAKSSVVKVAKLNRKGGRGTSSRKSANGKSRLTASKSKTKKGRRTNLGKSVATAAPQPSSSCEVPDDIASDAPNNFCLAVWRKIYEVPRGHVASYGDVAKALGCPNYSRHVGKALGALSGTRLVGKKAVPWWRIVNGAGRISPRDCDTISDGSGSFQRKFLEAEGVHFLRGNRIKGFNDIRARLVQVEFDVGDNVE